MVLALTWLHLTLGGSPGARLSSTRTGIPRQARSIAMVNPIGPPPAINTFVAMCLMWLSPAPWGQFARWMRLSPARHRPVDLCRRGIIRPDGDVVLALKLS